MLQYVTRVLLIENESMIIWIFQRARCLNCNSKLIEFLTVEDSPLLAAGSFKILLTKQINNGTRAGYFEFLLTLSQTKKKECNMTENVHGSVLVVGAGIAGMQSALDLAESGYYVYLLERSSAIGGLMAQLDKTFPTNDCTM